MQDHDFEKQVQQKMGQMKLLPSESVWEKVDMRLHRKENRRRRALWLPLAFAILFGSYWAFHIFPRQQQRAINAPLVKQTNPPGLGTNNALDNIHPADETDHKVGGKEPVTATPVDGQDKMPSAIYTSQKTAKPRLIPAASFTQKNAKRTAPQSSIPAAELNDNGFNPVISNETITTGVGADLQNRLSESAAIRDLLAVSVHTVPVNLVPVVIQPVSLTERLNAKTQLNKAQSYKSWSWGLSLQGGSTSLSSASFKLFNSALLDINSSSAPNAQNPGGPTFSGGNQVYKELFTATASTGFSAGLYVKRQLNRRFAISAGINYSLYRTVNTIGSKVDSLITIQSSFAANRQMYDQYYRSGNTVSYHHNYHFIEFPVAVQTRLSNSRKLPLSWDLGFSFSKLLTSNALHFNNATGVYYKDNTLLNRTQFNISSGLPVSLFNRRKFVLQAGPEFRYGITDALLGNQGDEKHFFFMGLKATLQLGEK